MSDRELARLEKSWFLPSPSEQNPQLQAELACIRRQHMEDKMPQEQRDHEKAEQLQNIFDSGVLEARTRTRRASLAALLRCSFVDEELQLLLFPLLFDCSLNNL